MVVMFLKNNTLSVSVRIRGRSKEIDKKDADVLHLASVLHPSPLPLLSSHKNTGEE